jgi:hypothetical protein
MPDEQGNETREEAEERIRIVRATQIFGDTPTDPTIGDVVVPTHDEEGAGVDLAAANADAEDEDSDELLSDAEVKRQGDAPQFEAAAEELEDEEAADDSTDEADELSAKEKIRRIENASSDEEVNALAEGDDRKTVKDAADKKRSSWG